MAGPVSRSDRLSALITAIDQWYAARVVHINRMIASQKKLLAARGSPTKNASDKAVSVVVTELKEFTG